MDRAVKKKARFIVDGRGRPQLVTSVADIAGTAAPCPAWLTKAWTGAKQRGLDALTSAEIEVEIEAYRREGRQT